MSRNRSLPRARSTHAGPRKRLSQNFLAGADTARLLVRASGVAGAGLHRRVRARPLLNHPALPTYRRQVERGYSGVA
ncbi:hypothetical protein AB0M14_30340, partial [Nocardia sp. NPDC051832]